MDTSRSSSRCSAIGLASLAGLVLLLRPGGARAAWDGTQPIVVGDRVNARFAGPPLTEIHLFPFFAPDEAKLSVAWKASRGQELEVTVLDPDLQPIATASHQKGNAIRRLPLPTRGRHIIQVKTTAGAGRYKLKTSARYPRQYGGKKLETPATGSFELELGLPAGTRLGAKVKTSRGSGATPSFAALDGPQGPVDLGAPNPTSFRKVRIGATGTFILSVAGGDGGTIDLRVKPKFPRGKRTYGFDASEITVGTAEGIRLAWLGSAHADLTAEPFAHWNDESPAVVPEACAKCHSGLGYRDFLGVLANPYASPPESVPSSNLDDPAPSPGQGQVASGPWPVGTPVDCDTCHNDGTAHLSEVTFPSGLQATGLGDESRCMVCHQGRESTVSVEKKIADAYAGGAITTDDTVSSAVSFINIHYFAAAGSLYGRQAAVAYEYADPARAEMPPDPVTALPARRSYDAKFAHVASKDVCFECHDQHSLKVRVVECATCHVDRNGDAIVTAAPTTAEEYAAAIERLHDVRMAGTINDFDGDGDANEGVYRELGGLEDVLYGAIRAYANTAKTDASGAAVPATPIAYSPTAYPYFFVDPNDNGVVDPGETTRYPAWTARLLRAAYDYQYAQKDPGAFAHNAKYLIEILYDAIADLNVVRPVPGFANLVRNDSGHFDTSAEAYRHWDEDTDHLVDPTCSRCHSPEGFLFRAKYGIDQTIPATLSSGMTCETCHETGAIFSPLNGNVPERRYIKSVTFPVPATATSSQIMAVTINNGAEGSDAEDDSYLCLTCHQGRESTFTVNAANPTPVTSFTLSFRNVHYLSAGGTQYGRKAAVAYQYAGKTYAPPWNHGTNYTGRCTNDAARECTADGDCVAPGTCDLYPHPVNHRARCAFCHMQDGSHSFEPEFTTACVECHGTQTLETITPAFRPEDDWDNDPTTKPKAEVAGIATRLLAAIQAYCAAAADSATPPNGASWVAYDGAAYPYWFKDANENGVVDPDETAAMRFDSKSLRAAFNYQYFQKEPGAWAHNNPYIVQILFDSIEDLGGDTTGITRP
ncbi:MAG TPA: hypothetical protein VKA21_02280 [Candidatus Binatia bacterium]|nr:hypothetical protein [Candidatus Binatia bacterium]